MKKREYYEYDPKRRRLAKIYSNQKFTMHFGNDLIIPIIALIILYSSGFLQRLASFALSYGNIIGIILFLLIFTTIMFIFAFPLRLYGSFFYEHKYGLSKQTIGKWFVDYLKNGLISYIILIPIGTITAYLALNTRLWWLYASLIGIVISVFIDFIYPIVILPFLEKLEPYKDRNELKVILDIIRKCGAKNIKNIKIMKESLRSTKVNAFFAGIGKTVSVILYDNLINKFTKREVRTVIGHELGHYVHKDIIKYTVIGGVQTVVVFFFADLFARALFLNNSQGYLPLYVMPIISGIIVVLEFIILPLPMAYSRKQEKAADIFALDYVKDPLAQISTEKRLADLDLVDENPHPFIEFWFHSHPAPEKRVKYTKEWMKLSKVKG